jgi:succinoglycan biosynthesis transport protein ExoP
MESPSSPRLPAQASGHRQETGPVVRQMNMNQTNLPPPVPQTLSMTLGDIYYVLFRHKGKIVICSAIGLFAAFTFHVLRPPPFQSEAKLFVRYVITDNKTLGPDGANGTTQSPDHGGETIMNTELQILTSLDLAKQVAEIVGPDKILAKKGGGNDVNRAAGVVLSGLTAEVPPLSSVIQIVFKHPDPAIVQPVLSQIIDSYLKKHVEIHSAVGIMGDFLTQETDQLRSNLAETEDQLTKALDKAGVVSVEDAKKSYGEQISRIRQDIFSAQAELAERSAILQEIKKQSPAPSPTAARSGAEQNISVIPSAQVDEYKSVCSRLDQLRTREQALLSQFTEENAQVKEVRAQIAGVESSKTKIEEEYPALAHPAVISSSTLAGSQSEPVDVAAESIQLTALQSKITVLNSQMDEVRADASSLEKLEGAILELRRKRDLEETNYRYYQASLEQARINEALGAGRVSNISQIQTPSPPFIDSAKASKIMAGLVAGGIFAGLAWAFFIEMFLDRSVRRPIDIERTLKLPLFLTIPDLNRSGLRRLAKAKAKQLERQNKVKDVPETAGKSASKDNPGAELALWDDASILRPFHETLRDRLIGYFESINLTHKPKLVAVTGLGHDSGVTTTAAGLAGCLSETGDGNVLLVDMTLGQGSARHFYRGKPVCGLEEILAARNSAQIQENLYVVAEEPGSDKLSRILPQRFTKLVPKLKASDFDYIIFDMPPVSQISITPRLAGFMDMVLLVIESEKTDRDLVQRATSLLAESKAHVGAVLNKLQTYVPSQLHQEYLNNI